MRKFDLPSIDEHSFAKKTGHSRRNKCDIKFRKFEKRLSEMKDVSRMRELIKEVIDDADDKTVEMVFKVLQEESDDLFENMSPEQEASLLRGLKDADEGRTIAHEEVMKKYEKWLSK